MIESEKLLEKKLTKRVSQIGGLSIKLEANITNGIPDRLILHKGKAYFVEMKTTGQKPRPIQKLMHMKLSKVGFETEVIDSTEGIEKFIQKIF